MHAQQHLIASYFDFCGYEPDDLITVCWKRGKGEPLGFAHVTVQQAPTVITDHEGTDVWVSAGVLGRAPTSGRGREDDIVRIPALWADLDLKAGSFETYAEIETVITELSTMLGVEPSVLVASGGGLQPRWAIEGDLDKLTLERFGQLVKKVCGSYGKHADPVYDLARILRAPGSTNHKYDPPRDVRLQTRPAGVLSVESLLEALEAYGIPEVLQTTAGPTTSSEPISETRGNAYAKAAVDGVLAELTASASWPVGYTDDRDRGWEKLQADCARRLHAIAAADWNDYQAGQLATLFYEVAPTGGDWTIRNVRSKWESEGRKAVPAPKPSKLGDTVTTPDPLVDDSLPEQQRLNVGNAKEMALFIKNSIGRGKLAGFFLRGNELVRTPAIGEEGYIPAKPGQSDGPAQVRSVSAQALQSHLTYSFDTYVTRTVGKGDSKQILEESALFPFAAAQQAVEGLDNMDSLRVLRGVTHTPLVRSDGSILVAPGYDDQTGLLYLPDPGLHVPDVNLVPSEEEVTRSRELLARLIADFPFVTASDRMNYLGLLITPVLRGLCPPPYKMGAMTAPSPGSGKTLLADIMRTVHGGVFRSEMPGDDAELKKSISAILDVTTGPVIHFDNLTGTLRSSALAGLLTSKVWSDRRLGSSTNIQTPNDRLWVITGNNLSIGGDIARRTITATIDPKMPNPHLRTGYGIDPLLPYVEEHRGELLWAMLTLARHWHVSGRPTRGKRSSDSFGPWIETVDGILHHAGFDGQFDDQATQTETGSVDDGEWGEFLAAVYKSFGDERFLGKEVLGRVNVHNLNDPHKDIPVDKLPTALLDKLRSNDNVLTLNKSFGRWLLNHNGRYAAYDGASFVVRPCGVKDGTKLWQVEKVML